MGFGVEKCRAGPCVQWFALAAAWDMGERGRWLERPGGPTKELSRAGRRAGEGGTESQREGRLSQKGKEGVVVFRGCELAWL